MKLRRERAKFHRKKYQQTEKVYENCLHYNKIWYWVGHRLCVLRWIVVLTVRLCQIATKSCEQKIVSIIFPLNHNKTYTKNTHTFKPKSSSISSSFVNFCAQWKKNLICCHLFSFVSLPDIDSSVMHSARFDWKSRTERVWQLDRWRQCESEWNMRLFVSHPNINHQTIASLLL